MSKLARQAEILKLSRFLEVEPGDLPGAERLDAPDLHAFRDQLTRACFDGDRALFQRVAMASKLLPASIVAVIAEKVFGPVLCARVAGQMDPPRAIDVAKRLHTNFLGDVCLHLDPRHVRDIIAGMPIPRIVDVAQELARRHEYVTMGRFVDSLGNDAIRAVLAKLKDNEALLHIAFFVENKSRLDAIMELVSEERMVEIIGVAAESAGGELWPEALGLMSYVSPRWRTQLADLAAGMDVSVLNSMVRSVQARVLWSAALPIVGDMSPVAQQRFANLPAVQTDAVIGDVLVAAGEYKLWAQLLPLVPLMDEDGQARVARLAERLDGEELLKIVDAAHDHGHWPILLDLVQRMEPEQRETMSDLIGVAPVRVLENLLRMIEQDGRWPQMQELLAGMRIPQRRKVLEHADRLGFGERIPVELRALGQ